MGDTRRRVPRTVTRASRLNGCAAPAPGVCPPAAASAGTAAARPEGATLPQPRAPSPGPGPGPAPAALGMRGSRGRPRPALCPRAPPCGRRVLTHRPLPRPRPALRSGARRAALCGQRRRAGASPPGRAVPRWRRSERSEAGAPASPLPLPRAPAPRPAAGGMLRSTGYFRGIDCPFLTGGGPGGALPCRRPYCHFRHPPAAAARCGASGGPGAGAALAHGAGTARAPPRPAPLPGPGRGGSRSPGPCPPVRAPARFRLPIAFSQGSAVVPQPLCGGTNPLGLSVMLNLVSA